MPVFDTFHRQHHQQLVGHRDAPVAVGVDRHVRRVTVLVPAVARRAGDPRVVRRRAKPRVHVHHEPGAHAAAKVREHQLELVQKARVQHNVLGPHVALIVMRHEVGELEMLGHLQVEILRPHFKEPGGPFVVPATESLRDIGADSIPIQSTGHFLVEGHNDRERGLLENLSLHAPHDRHAIKAWLRWRDRGRQGQGAHRQRRRRITERNPLVAERIRDADEVDRKIHVLARQRHSQLHIAAETKGIGGWRRGEDRGARDGCRQPGERRGRHQFGGTHELHDTNRRDAEKQAGADDAEYSALARRVERTTADHRSPRRAQQTTPQPNPEPRK